MRNLGHQNVDWVKNKTGSCSTEMQNEKNASISKMKRGILNSGMIR